MLEPKVTKEPVKRDVAPLATGELAFPAFPLEKMFGLSPFALLREFSDFMDRTLVPTKIGKELFAPAVDVKLADGKLVVTADLPGIKKEELKIEVTDKALVIEGERKFEEKEEKEGYKRIERTYGKFARTIPLPDGAKIDVAKAELKEGVLTVTLPVAEAKKGRSVPVETPAKVETKAA